MDNYSAGFDFEADLITLESISDYFGKKIYLINKIFGCMQYLLIHPEAADNKYLEKLRIEEKRLDLTAKLDEKKIKSMAKLLRLTSFIESYTGKSGKENPSPERTFESISAFASSRMVNMDTRKMNYFFYNDHDPKIFLKSLAEYFISGKCNPPEIVLQKHCKVKLCIALNSIYRHCKPETPLNEYSGFIKLLKKLSIFGNQSNYQIYKAIIRQNG